MSWKKNKKLVSQGFRDLQFLPKERSGWDATLASLAYGLRRHIAGSAPDLGDWAARHGVPASRKYRELGETRSCCGMGRAGREPKRSASTGFSTKGGSGRP
ncbi:MAG: hypothetical protein QF437_31740 [Planctomycetota bacterium]|nr:hypothetical protein [Planctomycetota bacterium]MDP7135113.1 hypothetical protein [Planctomycetota bacterium]MDP7251847.1 hypothetical protein [Planctomycetota bacterium]